MTALVAFQQVLAQLPALPQVPSGIDGVTAVQLARIQARSNDYSPFSPTIGAAVFWVFVAAICITPHVIRFLNQRELQKTIRQAMLNCQTMDPVVLDKLLASQNIGPKGPEGLLIGGAVVLAGGIGLTIMSYFITLQAGRPIYAVAGAGIMVALVGVALLLTGRWAMRRKAGQSGTDASE